MKLNEHAMNLQWMRNQSSQTLYAFRATGVNCGRWPWRYGYGGVIELRQVERNTIIYLKAIQAI